MENNICKVSEMDIKKEYKDDFYKEIIHTNNLRCKIVLISLCVIDIIWMILNFSDINIDYYLSLLMFILEIVGIFTLFFAKNKRYIGAIHLSIIAMCLIWAQYVNFSNYTYTGNFIPYLIALLGLASIACLKPKHSIILFAANQLVFLIINSILIKDSSTLVNVCLNSTIGAIFACIFSIFNFKSKLHLFLNKKLVAELNLANEKLKEYVHKDVGTGINNKLAFNEKLKEEWENAKQLRESISLIMLDIDFFKKYNDTYGHSKGDTCLMDVAQCISKNTTQATGFAGRYGGEEFVVILSRTDKDEAMLVAEKIRKAVEALNIPHKGRTDGKLNLTVSMGLAAMVPDNENTSKQLIEYADSALYAAKAKGRNKVEAFTKKKP